jgi:undecaprenyl-diphosphatase
MLPLLVALAVAALAAAAAAGIVAGLDRRTRRRGVSDRVPSASRVGAVALSLIAFVGVGIAVGVVAQAIERETVIVRWDERVARWASEQSGELGTDLLRFMTHLGDTVVVGAIALIGTGLLLWRGHRRLALFLATVVVGQWAISNLIKELVARARPELDPLSAFSGFSFPSGHATAAAATYLALAIVVSALRPQWSRAVLVAGAVFIAVAVAASRALLGVHWFSDVIGGVLLGWSWCLVCAVFYNVLSRRPRSELPDSSTSGRDITSSFPNSH